MRVDPNLALRFQAWRAGRAVPAHTHRRIALQPHALFLTAIQFPGEDNTILAAAIGGRRHRAPNFVFATPDPRLRDEETKTISRMHALLENYYQRCERAGVAPQLVVTSKAALRHLTHIADDLRFKDQVPSVAAFATGLSYFTLRAEVPDQQAVVVMTDVLRTHWITGLDPTQEEHLGALIAAIAPPGGVELQEAVRAAEQLSMGARTMPAFDHDVLQPALAKFHHARRRGAPAEELAPLRHAIERATATIVEQMYDALHVACDLLDRAALRTLPEVRHWLATEQQEFVNFRRAIAAGIRTPRTDKPKAATFRFAEREEAETAVSAAVACHDQFGQSCAVLRGASVEGTVIDVRRVSVPGQRTRATLVDVRTTQAALSVREHHELADRADHRTRYLVRGVRAEGSLGPGQPPSTRITLQMTAGVRRVGPPSLGVQLALVHDVPDLQRLGRIRHSLKRKLAAPHWTLGTAAPVAVVPGRVPNLPAGLPTDPLRALEVLR